MNPQERKDKEKRIKEYLKSQNIHRISNMQPEQKYIDTGEDIYVWNVKTSKGAWWVVEGDSIPINLYTQDAFYFSTDEAYSFHLGIVERLTTRNKENFKHILDEIPLDIERIKNIKRKLIAATSQLNVAIESEDFQAIGLICRECLIDLGKELVKRNNMVIEGKDFKAADFKNIANAFIDFYIPGSSNSDLRAHARKLVEIAWSYSSGIVHSPNKNHPDAKINILFVSTVVSLFENLFLKHLGFDNELKCNNCQSSDYEILESEKENSVIFKCKKCGFEDLLETKEIE